MSKKFYNKEDTENEEDDISEYREWNKRRAKWRGKEGRWRRDRGMRGSTTKIVFTIFIVAIILALLAGTYYVNKYEKESLIA